MRTTWLALRTDAGRCLTSWLGVSAENQKYADERIPLLLQTPASVRWLSAEPLLSQVEIVVYLSKEMRGGLRQDMPGIDWVVAGGESGPGARPMHPDWARSLRDQCQAAGVPFFFKQWGEWGGCDAKKEFKCTGERHVYEVHKFADDIHVVKRGKKANGRLLDGVEHSAYPKATAAAEAGRG
jgi:protein gp37